MISSEGEKASLVALAGKEVESSIEHLASSIEHHAAYIHLGLHIAYSTAQHNTTNHTTSNRANNAKNHPTLP